MTEQPDLQSLADSMADHLRAAVDDDERSGCLDAFLRLAYQRGYDAAQGVAKKEIADRDVVIKRLRSLCEGSFHLAKEAVEMNETDDVSGEGIRALRRKYEALVSRLGQSDWMEYRPTPDSGGGKE